MKTLILFSALLMLISCDYTPPEKRTIVYNINSIRVDDDAEYHIVGVSAEGIVETISDARQGRNFRNVIIRFSNIRFPVLKVHHIIVQGGMCEDNEFPYQVELPYGYKIETFED